MKLTISDQYVIDDFSPYESSCGSNYLLSRNRHTFLRLLSPLGILDCRASIVHCLGFTPDSLLKWFLRSWSLLLQAIQVIAAILPPFPKSLTRSCDAIPDMSGTTMQARDQRHLSLCSLRHASLHNRWQAAQLVRKCRHTSVKEGDDE